MQNAFTGDNIDDLKLAIRKELQSRNIDDNTIDEWLVHVE